MDEQIKCWFVGDCKYHKIKCNKCIRNFYERFDFYKDKESDKSVTEVKEKWKR